MPYPVVPWEHVAPNYHRGTILLGNGASIAVSPSFGYGSLLDHAQRAGLLGADVQQLFGFFRTSDFELILRLVWQASNVNRSLQIPDNRTHQAYLNVRECLIQAVRDVHPAYDLVSGHLPSMYQFLRGFDTVISLNYDLLVYWTMTYGLDIQDGHLFKDCFLGNGMFDDAWQRFRAPYRERTNTLVFYPHGSLALCRTAVEQEFKIHNAGEGLLEAILAEWRSERVVPLFVSEGTMLQKVSSIQNSYYLSTVYREVLTSQRFTLTLFGWGLGEHDRHLLRRMRGTGIQRVAVSVFGGNQVYCNYAYQVIQDDLGPVHVDFFDSESPGCWIHAVPPALPGLD
ncbi:TPA: DUF4917 family protein [Pseudomonas aeruginosa]|uniref:DUF4917 family protein n=1 Tax=Pseudomonadota TaxID=1224 RepID=UPI0003B9BC1F|nr:MULTISPECIES: DUF4917 family protein [Pseudomonadota]QEH81616.1 DUF4917 family protein [Sphingomonas sp. C8-2]ERU39358.1 hypothetical protein Q092_02371 [Pseudomonas aeruginosa CF77]MCD0495486.1 DUF4917 family protein [Achromobacter sp. MY14]MCT5441965.1 DUF4917 family protein [Pseudomonas aeruginosa]MCY4797640.1 DUF4917 family protein [Pseudomonas aeruginosa]